MAEPWTLDELRALAEDGLEPADLRRGLRQAADEIVALRAEVAAFRRAVIDRDGPSCEDVCMRSCIGVCGV